MAEIDADLAFRMHAERTPNPQSIKWVLGQELLAGGVTASFNEPVNAAVSPLAERLFAVDGVVGVFLASSFVTVTKRGDVEWPDIAQPIVDTLREFGTSGRDALGPEFEAGAHESQGEVVDRIREILEREIRPAVAMDGGDVVFAGFQDGVVEVMLQGSCVGCPSSTATLRFGIEARLREAVPEVTRVISV